MKSKKIYILHGWAYSTERWQPFTNLLEKEGVETEMLKIPGLTTPLNEVWNIENYVEWLDEILTKDHSVDSGQKKAILLGHSNGGLIALSYALKYPDRVEKIILIDSTGIYHNELSIRLKRWVFGTSAKVGKKFTNSPLLKKLLYRLAKAHDYENANPLVKKTMVNLIHTDLKYKFSEINIPTIIIWGEKDQVTPLSDGKTMNMEIKDSSLHIISGAKHSPQLTHPKETAEIIIKNL